MMGTVFDAVAYFSTNNYIERFSLNKCLCVCAFSIYIDRFIDSPPLLYAPAPLPQQTTMSSSS